MYEKCGIIILFYYCLRASFYKTGYDKKLLIEIVILSVILCSNYGLCISTHVPSNITIRQEPGICPSIDVRNSVEMFSKLKGCKVVEGFVSIALIDNINLNDYRNITFPELREITGYLLLYRVYALKSIGKLFPKLSVIRGHTLFLNYALLVFEMLNLQELGLVSLTNILRGSVYIAKNPMLCFVHTINWNLIAPESNEFKYITGNKLRNECPVCSVELNCPTSGNTGEALCWNVDHCQIVCPKHCGGSCNADGKCCHLECLGGCDAGGQSSDHCFSCRNVLFENKCISKCPANTYKYLNRRCVYESECYDMPKPREINKYNIKPNPWKPFRNECVLECPSNFLEVDIGISGQQKLSCELCEGNCRKECPGAKIDSPASAMTMRGCTLIRGSLEIQMRGGSNIVRELEDNLSSIEEITGYLKVVRSFALLSLNFLKKLKVIHGEILESSIYSLVILDNQNLMELWDWDKRERIFNIKSGRLFFHFNPKLCRSKIDELKEIANLSDYSELEVASNSNGHKVACNVTRLKAFIEKKSSVVAIVHWTQFEHYDPRKVLGYMVYYIEAPFRNITMFGGRDACGGDEWKVIDVSADENVTERGFHQTIITKLKPYTQYAYYVKTYTIASEKTGAISPIQYFRTNASTPSPPRSLNAYSNSSSELVITWLPPSEPNGNGTHYKLTAIWVRDTDEFVEQRNYCNEPPAILDTRTTPPTSSQEAQIPPEDNQEDFQMKYCPSCGCAPKKVNSDNREKEIKFEDSLQNFVYIKREQRVKRDVDNTEENMNHEFPASGVVRDTQYVITHLRHFSLYTVKVRACREVDIEEYASNNSSRKCSVEAVVTARTQSLASADNIDFNSTSWETSNLSVGAVNLKWKEPMSPNSVIVTYQIEYKRVDVPNLKPTIECITKKDFEKSGKIYTLSNLHSGNYSFRLRATSLAGPGEFTPYKYFTIQESISFSIYQLYGIILTCIVLASFVCVTVLYVRRQNRIPSRKLIASVNPEYVPTVYEPDDWEVARARVEILREIGQGSFGMVYEGILKSIDGNTECRCAVKTVNVQAADRDRIEFLNEASVMKAFNTQHVVKLLGVVSQGQPTLVIMELMGRGDLKSYLRSLRPENAENVTVSPPTQKRILRMAAEIADGMAYLAAKKFVHRDLAARNCMVADDLTVKIGDFGMTRDIYETEYYRKGKGSKGLLPVRWMAPESLKDGVFTSFSDAWSYGVVLYEMVTLASQPYQGLSNDQVLRYVIDGGIMSRPERCPDKLYTVMRLCWDVNPTNRPTFLELIEFLEPDIDKSFSQVSFYHSAEGREARSFAQPSLQTSELTPLTLSREGDDFSYSDAEDGYREASTSSKYSNASTPLNQYGLSTQSHQNYSPNNIDLHTTSC